MADQHETHSPSPNPNQSPRRRFRAIGVGIVAALLLLSFWYYRDGLNTRVPLPGSDNIRTIEASFFDRDQETRVKFQVPRDHWDRLLSTLQPARRDSSPAKWVGLGELNITLANGNPWNVQLYTTDEDPGAFASGSTFEKRVYYRGGRSDDLEGALTAAYHATQ